MIDKERREEMEKLLAAVRVVWFANPELRLGQLIENASSDTFYESDKSLLSSLYRSIQTYDEKGIQFP